MSFRHDESKLGNLIPYGGLHFELLLILRETCFLLPLLAFFGEGELTEIRFSRVEDLSESGGAMGGECG